MDNSYITNRKIHFYAAAVLILFYMGTYLLPLGIRPMMIPDEFRYGEIAREMLASGDWTVPRMNGIRYFEKPALGYQWNALTMMLFGKNAFSVRLPAALSVGLAALMIYWLLCRAQRDPWVPGWAAGIFMGFGMVFGVGTFSVLDSQLSMALTWCIGAYFLAWQSGSRRGTAAFLILAGAAAGTAFLFKGFLAFAVPGLTIAAFLVWQRDWKKIFAHPWLPLLLAVTIALPWSIAVWKAEPDFWNYFFIEEHWKRFTSSTYDRGREPVWFFLPLLMGGMLPSGLLLAAAWKGWDHKFLQKPLVRYCLCWFALPFLFFSLSSCKTGTYILPCFPPVAILIALGLRRGMLNYGGKAWIANLVRVWGWLFAAAGGAAVVVFAVWRTAYFRTWPLWTPDNLAPLAVGIAVLVYGVVLLMLRKKRLQWNLAWMLLGTVLLVTPVLCSFPEELKNYHKMPENFIRQALTEFKVSPDDIIVLNKYAASPTAWILDRNDLVIAGSKGEYAYGLNNYPEEYKGRYYAVKDIRQLVQQAGNRRVLYLIVDGNPKPSFGHAVKRAVFYRGVAIGELKRLSSPQ